MGCRTTKNFVALSRASLLLDSVLGTGYSLDKYSLGTGYSLDKYSLGTGYSLDKYILGTGYSLDKYITSSSTRRRRRSNLCHIVYHVDSAWLNFFR